METNTLFSMSPLATKPAWSMKKKLAHGSAMIVLVGSGVLHLAFVLFG
jgi:hypothetical protein